MGSFRLPFVLSFFVYFLKIVFIKIPVIIIIKLDKLYIIFCGLWSLKIKFYEIIDVNIEWRQRKVRTKKVFDQVWVEARKAGRKGKDRYCWPPCVESLYWRCNINYISN